jgi:hypothetical protein
MQALAGKRLYESCTKQPKIKVQRARASVCSPRSEVEPIYFSDCAGVENIERARVARC